MSKELLGSRKHPIPVSAIMLINIENNIPYVLVARRLDSYWTNEWTFPGGKRNRYERAKKAAARELLEETRLRIRKPEEFYLLEYLNKPLKVCRFSHWFTVTVFFAFFSDAVENPEDLEQKDTHASAWLWESFDVLKHDSRTQALPLLPYGTFTPFLIQVVEEACIVEEKYNQEEGL